MDILYQLLLRFCEFLGLEPATSALMLATIGFVALVGLSLVLVARGMTWAGEGLDRILEGLQRFLIGLFMLGTALPIALALYCLTQGMFIHIGL